MGAIGIVAEYDPFHLGHQWHIQQSKQLLGEERAVVSVMSGSWTQRGECALTDKWTRAGLALRGGVDLVLELPLPWALSSAERFARGAVEVLAATGVVDVLSFGSECNDLAAMERVAQCLDGDAYLTALRRELDKGASFAAARQRAVRLVSEDAAAAGDWELLSHPNNNLGVEYIRAIRSMELPLAPFTIQRQGVSHDSASPVGGFASASALRVMARRGEWDELARWTVEGTAERLRQAPLADMRYGERAVLTRLRSMDIEAFGALPDSGGGEGLPERLYAAAGRACSLEEFYTLAKTRRYAHSRLRRQAVRAFLSMTEKELPAHPRYIRVLGMTSKGKSLLREMKQKAVLPVIVKPAHAGRLEPEARALFEQECRGDDLYALFFEAPGKCGAGYTTSPVVL